MSQSRHLPTARLSRASRLSNSFSFSQSTSLTTLPWQWLLFEFSRLLAIVPASLGFVWCLWHIYAHVPNSDPYVVGVRRPIPDRIDYFIASLWVSSSAPSHIIILIPFQGTSHCPPMSFTNNRFVDALETLLRTAIYPRPFTRTTGYLLARNTPHSQHS